MYWKETITGLGKRRDDITIADYRLRKDTRSIPQYHVEKQQQM